MRHFRTALFVSVFALTASVASAQTTITQWNFNSVPSDGSTATGTTTPSIGTGVAALVGTTQAFASGAGSSDPATTDDSGWNVGGFPAQGTGSSTEGVQFSVNTTGFENIIFSFDQRNSNTASRFFQVQFSTNGTTFTNATGGLIEINAGETWFNDRTVDFSALTAVDNNPNFAVRIVSIFAPGTTSYTASNTGSTYGTGGTARFDMVTFRGAAIGAGGANAPEPATLALLALGGIGLVARRKK